MDAETRQALRLVAGSHRALANQLDDMLDDIPLPPPEPEPDPEPPDPEPEPPPGPAVLVSGPVGLPLGLIPRPGPGHDGAPQMGSHYRLASGAPVPSSAATTRGTAPITATAPDELMVTMARADVDPVGGATGMHEQHLRFGAGHRTVTFELQRKYLTPELGRTGKAGGLAAFDGDWGKWPGGGGGGPHNAMFRSCHWHWDQRPGTDRLTTVIRTGAPRTADIRQSMTPGGGGPTTIPRRYRSSDNTIETYLDEVGTVPIDEWITTRYVAHFGTPGVPDGWLDCYVDIGGGGLEMVQRLEAITWSDAGAGALDGWTQVYLSLMYGGTAEDYAPDNPERTGRVVFRGVRAWPGEVRP